MYLCHWSSSPLNSSLQELILIGNITNYWSPLTSASQFIVQNQNHEKRTRRRAAAVKLKHILRALLHDHSPPQAIPELTFTFWTLFFFETAVSPGPDTSLSSCLCFSVSWCLSCFDAIWFHHVCHWFHFDALDCCLCFLVLSCWVFFQVIRFGSVLLLLRGCSL